MLIEIPHHIFINNRLIHFYSCLSRILILILFLFLFSFYFHFIFILGTKALHSTHTHLYQKVSSTLVNQVDLTRYSSDEITQLVELEKSIIQKGSPFLLFAKGTLKLSINRANMISRFLWDWKVTSFREFVDSTKTVKR